MNTARVRLAAATRLLDEQKVRMRTGFTALTDNQRSYRPGPSSWSPLEVLDHVIRTEMAILKMMRTNALETRGVSLRDRVRRKLVLAVMFLPTRVSVPSQVSFLHPTGDTLRLSELETKWAVSRKALVEFVESLPEETLDRGVCRHPVSGWMTPQQTLLFLRAHTHHHGYQLARLRRASRSLPV